MWWLIGVYVVLLVPTLWLLRRLNRLTWQQHKQRQREFDAEEARLDAKVIEWLEMFDDAMIRREAEEAKRPGIRRRAARSGTISPEHYDELRRLGASEEFLARLRPVVREDEDRNER